MLRSKNLRESYLIDVIEEEGVLSPKDKFVFEDNRGNTTGVFLYTPGLKITNAFMMEYKDVKIYYKIRGKFLLFTSNNREVFERDFYKWCVFK